MDLQLDGEHVLVTGGSRGIGFACAQAFLREGCKLTLLARDMERLQQARLSLQAPDVAVYAADLRDAAATGQILEQIERERGPVGVLVNSAGAPRRTAFESLQPQDWQDALDAKFFTYMNVTTPLVRMMGARGRGTIVNVIGLGGKVPSPFNLPGGAANAALMLATAGLAAAWGSKGLRICAVNPSLTQTELLEDLVQTQARSTGHAPEAVLDQMLARIPMRRAAKPEEVADAVVYLASPRASYISGTILSIDGAAAATVL